MNKEEITEMLTILNEQSQSVKYDGKSAVLLTDIKLSSFEWVITETIKFLKEGVDNE